MMLQLCKILDQQNDGQLTSNMVDTTATGGQRLVTGPRVSKVEERETPGVYVVAFYLLDTSLTSVLAAT
jgi:hypothetical protein